jgi:hypothetical protein
VGAEYGDFLQIDHDPVSFFSGQAVDMPPESSAVFLAQIAIQIEDGDFTKASFMDVEHCIFPIDILVMKVPL